MRKIHNEQGYALLIVLFLVVFIMTVSAVFIRGSLGNAKQEIKVDESHLTVIAAEAGVDYYKTYVSNYYNTIISDLELFVQNDFQSQLNEQNNKDKIIDYNKTRKNVTSKLETIFNEKILDLTLGKNIGRNSFEVETTSIKAYPEKYTVIVEGVSTGMKNGIEKEISFKQSFLIPDFSGSSSSGGGGGVVNIPNMHKLYPDNVSTSDCNNNSNGKLNSSVCMGSINGDYKEISNSTVYFKDGFEKSNGNLEVKNSTIFSKNYLDVENFNQIIGSDLNIDNKFKAKNVNGIKNSTIKINGSVDITSNLKMVDSMILIRGSAHYKGHLEVKNNSLVCVSGSLQVDKHLDIGHGSKLVYWGSFVANGGIKGEIIQAGSEQEVWEKCKVGKSEPVNWNNPTIEDVIYK